MLSAVLHHLGPIWPSQLTLAGVPLGDCWHHPALTRTETGQLEEKTVSAMLQEMVKTLDSREATILRYRFGLDGGSEKTLEEVGQKFGVTRERVRQIQNIALAKLRKMIEKFEAVKK